MEPRDDGRKSPHEARGERLYNPLSERKGFRLRLGDMELSRIVERRGPEAERAARAGGAEEPQPGADQVE